VADPFDAKIGEIVARLTQASDSLSGAAAETAAVAPSMAIVERKAALLSTADSLSSLSVSMANHVQGLSKLIVD
jgi:hypothetical protein